MKTNIVLINPLVERVVEEYDAPPYGHIGLVYLGAALRKDGFNPKDCIETKMLKNGKKQI